METILAILFGILQGITEFLPISSSGHLAFYEKIAGKSLKLTANELHLFNVMVHLATVLAVIVVFRKILKEITVSIFKKEEYKNIKQSNRLWLVILIITASIPTAILGLLGKKIFKKIESNLLFIGIMFFVTAILLLLTLLAKKKDKDEYKKINIFHAIIVGIVQGFSIAPGISRSGSTIATSRFLGISREKSGEFSFLIAIPAILGATVLEFSEAGISSTDIYVFIAGFISAFISGYLALRFLLYFVRRGKLHYFAYYVIIMGILSIVLYWRGL